MLLGHLACGLLIGEWNLGNHETLNGLAEGDGILDDLSLVRGGLAVVEQPDVGADAGIVKDLRPQGDDGLQPVVFHDPAVDFRFARAGPAGEERRAVEDDAVE